MKKSSFDHTVSRRKAVSLIGLGILATQIPFACTPKIETLSDSEKKSIHFKTLSAVAELIKSGKISSEELTQRMLNRIVVVDAKLNSYITVMSESAFLPSRCPVVKRRTDFHLIAC